MSRQWAIASLMGRNAELDPGKLADLQVSKGLNAGEASEDYDIACNFHSLGWSFTADTDWITWDDDDMDSWY